MMHSLLKVEKWPSGWKFHDLSSKIQVSVSRYDKNNKRSVNVQLESGDYWSRVIMHLYSSNVHHPRKYLGLRSHKAMWDKLYFASAYKTCLSLKHIAAQG